MGSRAWLQVPGIRNVDSQDLSTLDDIARELGIDPDELATIISLESGWRADAHNSIPAGGLIGFLPSTMRTLGWQGTPEGFFALSIAEQLPFVARFYHPFQGKIHRRGDLYLATFWPVAVGAPDDQVIAADGGPNPKVWEQNPGLRSADHGPITAGSVRAILSQAMAKAEAKPRYIPGPSTGHTTGEQVKEGAAIPGALILIGLGLWWLHKRRRRSSGKRHLA